jgi:hypothetical protein
MPYLWTIPACRALASNENLLLFRQACRPTRPARHNVGCGWRYCPAPSQGMNLSGSLGPSASEMVAAEGYDPSRSRQSARSRAIIWRTRTPVLTAENGAGGGGRTHIPSMASWNSQPLNHARKLVETIVVEPMFPACRAGVLAAELSPRKIAKRMSAAAGSTALDPGFHASAVSMATIALMNKLKTPRGLFCAGGVRDLAILAWVYPGGTPPVLGGILAAVLVPRERPCVRTTNNRC